MRFWTRQRIVGVIQRWAELHGRPPTSDEWDSTHDWKDSKGRFRNPATNTIKGRSGLFPTWNAALRAAGFSIYDEYLSSRQKMLLALLADRGPLYTTNCALLLRVETEEARESLLKLERRGFVTGTRYEYGTMWAIPPLD